MRADEASARGVTMAEIVREASEFQARLSRGTISCGKGRCEQGLRVEVIHSLVMMMMMRQNLSC